MNAYAGFNQLLRLDAYDYFVRRSAVYMLHSIGHVVVDERLLSQ